MGIVGHLLNGRLAERERTRLLEVASHELDDSEKLVADVGMLAAEERRQLLEPSIPPDPAIERER